MTFCAIRSFASVGFRKGTVRVGEHHDETCKNHGQQNDNQLFLHFILLIHDFDQLRLMNDFVI